MFHFISLILVAFIVGVLAYLIGECNGYYMGLDDLGYTLDGEGVIVKKEENQ